MISWLARRLLQAERARAIAAWGLDRPPGCHFHPRRRHAMPVCRAVAPEPREIASGHRAVCHLNDRGA
jgi:ABC-type dipeptide/oligopeptide/nickel transport system ATPase component